jgi:NDP-sugar pyrophosphorylase family protein
MEARPSASARLQGMILAAGRGDRLRPLTDVRAKPACPIGTWPLVRFALEFVRRQGLERVALNLHHLAETVSRRLAACTPAGLQVEVAFEPALLGTGGGPRRLLERFDRSPILLVNGKLILDGDLRVAIERHRSSGASATLFVRPNPAPARYSSVVWDQSSGRLLGFRRAGEPVMNDHRWVFTGVQLLDPGLLARLEPDRPCDLVSELYAVVLREGGYLRVEPFPGAWLEISDLETYVQAHRRLLTGALELTAAPSIHDGCCLDPSATIDPSAALSDSVVGAGSSIGPGARLDHSLVWERVRVGTGARLTEVIATDGVEVPSGAEYERSILLAGSGGTEAWPWSSSLGD